MRKILLTSLLMAFAATAVAQQQYGRLEGAASDAQGLALPGVTVTLAGEAIIGTRVATTDVDGSYRFQALPPGDYTLTFELGGFQTVLFEEVRVVSGATFAVDADMQIATVAETITVTGESPVVDVKSTGVAATFDKTQLDEVPTATDMWAVLHQSPGVRVQGYDVGGSHKSQQSMYETFGVRSQNRVLYEGVNTTEGTGSAGGYYDYYAMEEFQVSAQGADVEMSTPGAQIQTTVKSGGNEFSGLESGAWNPADWIADNFDSALDQRGGTPAPVLRFYEFHLDLGGPIVRDKAWFYAAYNNFLIDTAVSGQPIELGTDIGDFDIFTAKLNYQITERDQFIGFSTWSWKRKPNRSLSATIPAESILAQDYWIWLHKAEWQRVWSDRLYSNIMIGHMGTVWPMVPKADPVNGNEPRVEASSGDVRSGAGWQPFTSKRWKPQSTAQFNYYVPIGNGSHDFKFGWDWQWDTQLFGWNTNSGAVRYLDDAAEGRPHNVDRVYMVGVPNLTDDRNMHADFFVQDTWTVNDRLTLTAGVRVGSQILSYVESDNVPGSSCPDSLLCQFELPSNQTQILQDQFGSGSTIPGDSVRSLWNFAPRVGFTYDITGAGRSVFKAYFGRYFSNVGTGLGSANPGGQASGTWRFLDQNMNGVLDDSSELGERLGFSAGAGASTPIDDDWSLAYADELSASLEHELTNDLGARVSYVYKRMRNTWGTVDLVDLNNRNTPMTVNECATCPAGFSRSFNLVVVPEDMVAETDNLTTNHPSAESAMDFHTLSLALNRRFRNNLFYNIYFDYQWRSEPRSAGTSSTSWAARNPLSSDPTAQGWFINFDQDIPTIQDTSTFQLKTSARYVMPYEIGLAGTYRWVSGFNYAPTHRLNLYDGALKPYVWLGPMSENRSDNVTVVDFRIDKSFGLGDRVNIQFIFDLFNALNANTITNFQLLDTANQKVIDYLKGRTIGLSARLTF